MLKNTEKKEIEKFERKKNEIIESLINVDSSASRILIEKIKKENIGILEGFLDNFKFAVDQWAHSKSEMVIEHNNNVARSIRWFVQNNKWTNLISIKNCLFDDIIGALKNDSLNKTMNEMVIDSINMEKEFSSLSLKDKRKALNSLKD